MNKRPPHERIPKENFHLDEEGRVKPVIFNTALAHAENKLPWLARMAAEGKLSDRQLQQCQKQIPGFEAEIASIRREGNNDKGLLL